MISRSSKATILLLLISRVTLADDAQDRALELLDHCNVKWSNPSKNAWGSMPLGNGDIGINFWVEANGDFVFYISKADAWSEGGALLKLGRVRVRFEPNPTDDIRPFVQQLDLRNGEITVETGKPGAELSTRIWIDAHNPTVVFESNSKQPVQMQVSVETWRNDSRELTDIESHTTLLGTPIINADTVLDTSENQILWCHRNEISFWDYDKSAAALPELKLPKLEDPHLNRTFGGLLSSKNLKKIDSMSMKSAEPTTENRFSIYVHTAQTDTQTSWENDINDICN